MKLRIWIIGTLAAVVFSGLGVSISLASDSPSSPTVLNSKQVVIHQDTGWRVIDGTLTFGPHVPNYILKENVPTGRTDGATSFGPHERDYILKRNVPTGRTDGATSFGPHVPNYILKGFVRTFTNFLGFGSVIL